MSADDRIDEALIALFEDAKADAGLAALGPAAVRRVVGLYRHREPDFPPRLRELIMELRRESIDCWRHALHVVARVDPEVFLEQLDGELSRSEIVTLEGMDHPGAAALLNRHRTG